MSWHNEQTKMIGVTGIFFTLNKFLPRFNDQCFLTIPGTGSADNLNLIDQFFLEGQCMLKLLRIGHDIKLQITRHQHIA